MILNIKLFSVSNLISIPELVLVSLVYLTIFGIIAYLVFLIMKYLRLRIKLLNKQIEDIEKTVKREGTN
jgi:hypothetical protein